MELKFQDGLIPAVIQEKHSGKVLMLRPGAIVRREEMVRAVWNLLLAESGKTLDVHMSVLRKKLGDEARRPRYIETVRGVGFRLAVG